MVNRVILIVLDSLGVGAMPDAGLFEDTGANTLLHLSQDGGPLDLPHLESLGLGRLSAIGCESTDIIGCFGRMAEKSANKDTITGHWEIAGLVLNKPFPTYPDGFPDELLIPLETAIGTPLLGNYHASGTTILEELGREHLRTGFPILYTSADSVMQIAAHKAIIPLETLYQYCRQARRLLHGRHAVGRVIARPFEGEPGRFERDNGARKDYALIPPADTLLDLLTRDGCFTCGIGKIGDIFGHRGVSEEVHTASNHAGIEATLAAMGRYRGRKGLIFTNLVDFDMVYGHRRNASGYARALEAFDRRLPEILAALAADDILVITADHGCDPAFEAHTDHTREYVPLLVYGPACRRSIDLGTRDTFADCGQTIADCLALPALQNGVSFKHQIF